MSLAEHRHLFHSFTGAWRGAWPHCFVPGHGRVAGNYYNLQGSFQPEQLLVFHLNSSVTDNGEMIHWPTSQKKKVNELRKSNLHCLFQYLSQTFQAWVHCWNTCVNIHLTPCTIHSIYSPWPLPEATAFRAEVIWGCVQQWKQMKTVFCSTLGSKFTTVSSYSRAFICLSKGSRPNNREE